MILEREAELDAVRHGIASAAAGRGQALLAVGEAGIGKTALLDAARELGAEAGFRSLNARATQLEGAVAFGVIRQLLLPPVLALADEDRRALLHGAAGLAEPVLFGDAGAPASPLDTGFAAVHGSAWLVASLAAVHGPLLLLADDLHWADAPSLRALAAIAGLATTAPVLLVLAARRTDDDQGLAAQCRPLRPGRLSAAAVRSVIVDRLGPDPDPAFVAVAAEQTRGTPYLVDALVRQLEADAVSPTADNLGRIVTAEAGTAVQPWVGARLAGLPLAARELARAVAVIGDGRPAAEAVAVAAITGTGTEEASALEAAGLLVGWPLPAFEHALVRNAVLADLGEVRATALHARAATIALAEADHERAAAHLARCPGTGSADAVAALTAVADAARRRGAPDVAAIHLRRALVEPPDAEALPGVLFGLGVTEVALGSPQAPDQLQAAAAAARDPITRLLAGALAGHALSFSGRWDEAFRAMDDAIRSASDAPPPMVVTTRLELVAALLSCHRSVPEGLRRLAQIEAETGGDHPGLDAICALRDAITGRPFDEVRERGRRAVAAGLRPAAGPVELLGIVALVLADDHEVTGPRLAEAVTNSRRRGDRTMVQIMSAWHALALWRMGDGRQAEQKLLDVSSDQLGVPSVASVMATAVAMAIAVDRGDLDRADELADPPPATGIADTVFGSTLLVARADAHLAAGRHADALKLLEEVGRLVEAWGGSSMPGNQWRALAALAHHGLGRSEQARELAEAEVADARRAGSARAIADGLRVLATVDTRNAGALLEEAEAVMSPGIGAVARARVLVALGVDRTRAGRDVAAREPLREALDLAWRGGATAVEQEARAALVAAGARPRRHAVSGASALTPGEARTARMAADGLSNREIAETLFVTEKTVEGHLTSAYRKLDVSGRGELAGAL